MTPTTPTTHSDARLATLTGLQSIPSATANPEGGQMPPPVPPPLLTEEELEVQLTRHSFASNPLTKLAFVGGGALAIVFAASLFLAQFQSPGETVAAKDNRQPPERENPLLSQPTEDKEKAELLSELALREQKDHLQDLSQQPSPVKPVKAVERQEPKAIRPRPARTVRPPVNAPPHAVRLRPAPTSLPPRLPAVRFTAPPRPRALADTQDPARTWQEVAQLGSFGGASPLFAAETRPERVKTPLFQPLPDQTAPSQPSPPPDTFSNSLNAVALGQVAAAVLESTVAWEGTRTGAAETASTGDRYLVTLTQPLKDKVGNEQVPAGAQVVAHLASTGPLVNLVAEALILNGREIPLPPGAIKLRAQGNQPLMADSRQVGGGSDADNSRTIAELMSIAGDFANIPGSRSLGSLMRLLDGGSYPRRLAAPVTIWFVPAGVPLEVYVNKSFSVTPPETPLELDLSDIAQPQEVAATSPPEPLETAQVDPPVEEVSP